MRSIRTQHGYILTTITNAQASLLISNLVNLKLSELNYYIIILILFYIYKYYLNIILNNKYFKCNQTDLELYWITNHYTNILQEIILQSVTETLNNTNLEITQSQFLILKNLIIHHPSLQLSTNSFNTINLYTLLKGLLPYLLTQTIQLYTNSVYLASQITIKLFLKLNSKIYEQIWLPYCSEFTNWKQQYNIHIPHSNSQQNYRNS